MTTQELDIWVQLERSAVRRDKLAAKFSDKADTLHIVSTLGAVVSDNRREAIMDMVFSHSSMAGFNELHARYEAGKAGVEAGFKQASAWRKRSLGLRLSAFAHRAAAGLGRGMMPFCRVG